MCCKSNTCLLSQSMIFSLKLEGLFGDKGKSTKQVSLKTIMNTMIQSQRSYQTLLGCVRKFSKSGKVFIWKSRFFRLFYQEEEIKKVQEKEWENKLMGINSFVTFQDTGKGMLKVPKDIQVHKIFSMLNKQWWISPIVVDRFLAHYIQFFIGFSTCEKVI